MLGSSDSSISTSSPEPSSSVKIKTNSLSTIFCVTKLTVYMNRIPL